MHLSCAVAGLVAAGTTFWIRGSGSLGFAGSRIPQSAATTVTYDAEWPEESPSRCRRPSGKIGMRGAVAARLAICWSASRFRWRPGFGRHHADAGVVKLTAESFGDGRTDVPGGVVGLVERVVVVGAGSQD